MRYIQYYRGGRSADGSADYFTKVLEDNLKAVTKPQYVDQLPRAIKSEDRTVGYQMNNRSQVGQERLDEIIDVLGMYLSQLVI